jgi:hypothetical protein
MYLYEFEMESTNLEMHPSLPPRCALSVLVRNSVKGFEGCTITEKAETFSELALQAKCANLAGLFKIMAHENNLSKCRYELGIRMVRNI